MKHESNRNYSIGKSSLFSADENVSGAVVGVVTIAASFVPYVSYFAWIIPAVAAVVERKSIFSRLCDIQNAICAALISMFSWLTIIITPQAEEAMKSASGNKLFIIGALGIALSLIRVAFLICMILTSYDAYKLKIFHIPGVTLLIKKSIKYSEN